METGMRGIARVGGLQRRGTEGGLEKEIGLEKES